MSLVIFDIFIELNPHKNKICNASKLCDQIIEIHHVLNCGEYQVKIKLGILPMASVTPYSMPLLLAGLLYHV